MSWSVLNYSSRRKYGAIPLEDNFWGHFSKKLPSSASYKSWSSCRSVHPLRIKLSTYFPCPGKTICCTMNLLTLVTFYSIWCEIIFFAGTTTTTAAAPSPSPTSCPSRSAASGFKPVSYRHSSLSISQNYVLAHLAFCILKTFRMPFPLTFLKSAFPSHELFWSLRVLSNSSHALSCSVPDPDPYVLGPLESGSFHQQAKIFRYCMIYSVLWLLYVILSLKTNVNLLYLQ